MGRTERKGTGPLSRIERVRCLKCSTAYVKPTGGGTVSANPGCPECGYVGWVRLTPPPQVTPGAARTRSVGDPQHRRSA